MIIDLRLNILAKASFCTKIWQKLNNTVYLSTYGTVVKKNIQFAKHLLLIIESFSLTVTW